MDARFDGKSTVSVRCGGKGAEMVDKEIHVKTRAGTWKTVRLIKLVQDYGPGDVAVFTFSWK